MKKICILSLFFSLIFIVWCNVLWNKSEKEVTEIIWSRNCTWKWVNKIEWYANCTTTDGWRHVWDVWGHNFNWKWERSDPNWGVLEWYFYNWQFVAWKVTKNWISEKWLRKSVDGSSVVLELGKRYKWWNISLWEFDNEWNLSYGLYYVNIPQEGFMYFVWKNEDWYFVLPSWCARILNWKVQEITRTVTNTVYRDNWIQLSSALWDFYTLWSKYNPYTINLNFK